MAVTIRLSRQGAKNEPLYSIVAVDSQKKRDGEVLARIGRYFPKAATPDKKLQIDLDAFKAWQAKGATISQTVGQLVRAASLFNTDPSKNS